MKGIIIVISSVFVFIAILYLFYKWYVNHFFKKLKLLYNVDEAKEIVIEKNLIYKENDKQNLLMDIYRPNKRDNGEKYPVIIFLHGEGIERLLKDVKEWSFYTTYGRVAASKGYAAITFHRNRTNLNFSNGDVAKDILDAVEFVRNNASKWNIDKNRICIWGFSLGGLYLSLFLKDTPKYIRCLISYYGLLDVSYRVKNLNEEHRDYLPENYLPEITEGLPPLLIVKAGKDKVKGVNESQDHFIEVARKRNVLFELITHTSGGHTFDALTDNDETRGIMDKTWDFIDRNV
jgi:acetyl esterase/lipase